MDAGPASLLSSELVQAASTAEAYQEAEGRWPGTVDDLRAYGSVASPETSDVTLELVAQGGNEPPCIEGALEGVRWHVQSDGPPTEVVREPCPRP